MINMKISAAVMELLELMNDLMETIAKESLYKIFLCLKVLLPILLSTTHNTN
jgi:hypothetical protein